MGNAKMPDGGGGFIRANGITAARRFVRCRPRGTFAAADRAALELCTSPGPRARNGSPRAACCVPGRSPVNRPSHVSNPSIQWLTCRPPTLEDGWCAARWRSSPRYKAARSPSGGRRRYDSPGVPLLAARLRAARPRRSARHPRPANTAPAHTATPPPAPLIAVNPRARWLS